MIKMQSCKYPIWSRFWFSWFVITVLYIMLGFYTESHDNSLIFKVVNLFTPFGIFNTVASIFNPLGWLGMIMLLILFFVSDKSSYLMGIFSFLPKIIFNLFVLFLFTCLIDLMLWHKFVSVMTLMGMDTGFH